jgi:hypothetical protein
VKDQIEVQLQAYLKKSSRDRVRELDVA